MTLIDKIEPSDLATAHRNVRCTRKISLLILSHADRSYALSGDTTASDLGLTNRRLFSFVTCF